MAHVYENAERRVEGTARCPFCGGKDHKTVARSFYESQFNDGSAFVECLNCGANLWNFPHKAMTYDEAVSLAVQKWNRRYCA